MRINGPNFVARGRVAVRRHCGSGGGRKHRCDYERKGGVLYIVVEITPLEQAKNNDYEQIAGRMFIVAFEIPYSKYFSIALK